jgi:hypothetical protein
MVSKVSCCEVLCSKAEEIECRNDEMLTVVMVILFWAEVSGISKLVSTAHTCRMHKSVSKSVIFWLQILRSW